MGLNENEYIEKTIENCIHCFRPNRCEACKKLVSTEQQRRDILYEQEKILKHWLININRYYSKKPW